MNNIDSVFVISCEIMDKCKNDKCLFKDGIEVPKVEMKNVREGAIKKSIEMDIDCKSIKK